MNRCLTYRFAPAIPAGAIFCVFSERGYQMATKKGGKALGRKGCEKCKILDGYQMATRGTF